MATVGGRLYSVEQVAAKLGLHVRTVRTYIHDGRLHAVRIGKQYRIAEADLDALTFSKTEARRPRHVDFSAVVHLDGIGREEADRLTTTLMAATAGHRDGEPLRVETSYHTGQERMKIIVWGDLAAGADVLKLIDTLTGEPAG